MDKEEFYSVDQFYKEHAKAPKEVKRMISEGKIRVFREADKVKLVPALDINAEGKKKKRKHRFTSHEQQYYTLSCEKFRQESWLLLLGAAITASLLLVVFGAFPTASPGIFLGIAVFFLSLAELALLTAAIMAMLANAFFSRFLVLSLQETRLGDRKTLLSFFSKGYARKQAAKILWSGALGIIALFLLFYLAHLNPILCLCIIMVIMGLGYWIYGYMKMIEKTGILRLPRKPLAILEEDVSNIYPGTAPQQSKSDIDSQLALSGIVTVLQNSEAKVRRNAVKSLARISSPEAIQILITTIGDSAPEVRAQAVAALGRIGEKSVLDAIICILDDVSSEVRTAAAEALGNMQAEQALESLIAALNDDCPDVRGAAAEALGNLSKKKSLNPLLEKLDDSDWFVRHKTVVALGKIKADLALEGIEKLMRATTDKHEYVAAAAKHVLKKLAQDMSQEDPLYEEVTEALENEPVEEDDENVAAVAKEQRLTETAEHAIAKSEFANEDPIQAEKNTPDKEKNETAESEFANEDPIQAEKNTPDKEKNETAESESANEGPIHAKKDAPDKEESDPAVSETERQHGDTEPGEPPAADDKDEQEPKEVKEQRKSAADEHQ